LALACYFFTLTVFLPYFSHPFIFSTSGCHPSFSPTFFSYFLLFLLLYSFSLFLCFVLLTAHCSPKCASIAHYHTEPYLYLFFFLYCAHHPYLGLLSKLYPKFPIQQVPNSHLWLILIHLGLFPDISLKELLGGILFYLHFFEYRYLYLYDLFDP